MSQPLPQTQQIQVAHETTKHPESLLAMCLSDYNTVSPAAAAQGSKSLIYTTVVLQSTLACHNITACDLLYDSTINHVP